MNPGIVRGVKVDESCYTGRATERTGLHVNGGYAEYVTAPAAYTFQLPDGFSFLNAAPLLCAGVNGNRGLHSGFFLI